MGPDAAMLAPAEALARFIATGDDDALAGLFADGPVTIVENFAPFVFDGQDAVARWTEAMRAHAAPLSGLVPAFGPPQDFAQAGGRTYFALPTTWRGAAAGRRFEETGGWSFVLEEIDGAWRVRAYAWSVTGVTRL